MKRMLNIQPFEPELTLYTRGAAGTTEEPLAAVRSSKVYNNSFIIGDKIYIDYQIDFSGISAYTVDGFRQKLLGIKIPGRFYHIDAQPKDFHLDVYGISDKTRAATLFSSLSRVGLAESMDTKNTDFFKNPYVGLFIRFGQMQGTTSYYIYHVKGWIDADQWVANVHWAKSTIYNGAGLGPLVNTTTGASYEDEYSITEWRIIDVKGKWVMKDPNGSVADPADYGLTVSFVYENGHLETTPATCNPTLRQYEVEITEDMYIGPNGAKPVQISISTY